MRKAKIALSDKSQLTGPSHGSSHGSGYGSGHTAPNSYRAALRGLVPVLTGVLGFSAVLNVLMLTGSVYMLQVYDRVLASGSVPTLLGLFAIVIVLYSFLGFYDFLRTRLLSRGALRLDQSTGGVAFQAWIGAGVPGAVTGSRSGGARSGSARSGGPTQPTQPTQPLRDLDMVRGFLSGPTVMALFDLPFVPLYLGVLFIIHPWLGWVTVAGAGVTALIAVANRMLTRGPVSQAAVLDEAERDFSDKCHRNAETIIAMGMQSALTARWQGLHRISLAGGQQGSDPSEMLAATSRAFRMLLQSGILTLGAYLVILGEISGGMIIASSVLSGRALGPVDQLIGQWRSLGKAQAAHQRLTAFFATQNHPTTPITLPDPTGQISVTGLTRQRAGGGAGIGAGADVQHILSGISFTLNPGDGLGVIGNSASGKSTLARLLVGAMAADQGEIRLDGATPDQWDAVQLGRKIGYLPQTVGMLPGSIRDNIARFDPDASDAAVIQAARATGVHDMILKLPDGYATVLGQAGGVQLSGGQVQRLGLARAIYGHPAIVVLDEPNSNLDVAGDNALTQAITDLRAAGSTVIVMAHRPSAIAAVNKLMILEAGKLLAFGDKEAVLMQATGLQAAATPRPSFQTSRLSPVSPVSPLPHMSHLPPLPPLPRGRPDSQTPGTVQDGLARDMASDIADVMPDIPFVRIPTLRNPTLRNPGAEQAGADPVTAPIPAPIPTPVAHIIHDATGGPNPSGPLPRTLNHLRKRKRSA